METVTRCPQKLTLLIIATFLIILLLCASKPEVGVAAASDYRETPVVQAVRIATPAVVNINSTNTVAQNVNPFTRFGRDPFFEEFFRDFFEPRYRKQQSLGSGVIIDGKHGHILTNDHVVMKASEITVTLADQRSFSAELVGSDPDLDLAVLRIEVDEPLPSIPMGDSDALMIGETVIAIGNPFGFSHSVTTGVVSAINRSFKTETNTYHDFIQTDALINPGNSGGPLLDLNGKLVGINTAIYAKAQGIGFAIPINRARRVYENLIRYGEVHLPWLGLEVQELTEQLAAHFGFSAGSGLLVSDVTVKSPAAAAAIEAGDIITRLNEKLVHTAEEYREILGGYTADSTITLSLVHSGLERKIPLKARRFPLELAPKLTFDTLGVRVIDISPNEAGRYRLPVQEGALVKEVRPDSSAAALGIRPGDIIRRINDRQIEKAKDLHKALISFRLKTQVSAVVQRGSALHRVAWRLY